MKIQYACKKCIADHYTTYNLVEDPDQICDFCKNHTERMKKLSTEPKNKPLKRARLKQKARVY